MTSRPIQFWTHVKGHLSRSFEISQGQKSCSLFYPCSERPEDGHFGHFKFILLVGVGPLGNLYFPSKRKPCVSRALERDPGLSGSHQIGPHYNVSQRLGFSLISFLKMIPKSSTSLATVVTSRGKIVSTFFFNYYFYFLLGLSLVSRQS